MLFALLSAKILDDVLVLETLKQLDLLLECFQLFLLLICARCDQTNRYLLDGYLATSHIESFIDITEAAMSDHFAFLPLRDRPRRGRLFQSL